METDALSFERTEAILDRYAQDVIANYRASLKDNNVNASWTLSDTLTYEVRSPKGGCYEVVLNMADYWSAVEHGRPPGTWPDHDAIKTWIEVKPVTPYPLPDGTIPSLDTLAFLIERKIYTFGIEPRPILQRPLEETTAYYMTEIERAVKEDMADNFRGVFVEMIDL